MEFLDVYNEKGKLLGKTIARGDKNLRENEFIKLAVIWIKCKDKFLIQKCSEEKGGEYAVSGGHVPTGFTSKEQASIELEEELGLKVKSDKLNLLGTIKIPHALFDVFMYEDNTLDKRKFVLQESEVEDVLWLTKQEIEKLIASGEFRKLSALQYQAYIKDEVESENKTN